MFPEHRSTFSTYEETASSIIDRRLTHALYYYYIPLEQNNTNGNLDFKAVIGTIHGRILLLEKSSFMTRK